MRRNGTRSFAEDTQSSTEGTLRRRLRTPHSCFRAPRCARRDGSIDSRKRTATACRRRSFSWIDRPVQRPAEGGRSRKHLTAAHGGCTDLPRRTSACPLCNSASRCSGTSVHSAASIRCASALCLDPRNAARQGPSSRAARSARGSDREGRRARAAPASRPARSPGTAPAR